MKQYEAFKCWYATEGVRTPAYPKQGETSTHEEYARIAYDGGWKDAMAHACDIVDELDKELKKTS
jgi:hypothetical protein